MTANKKRCQGGAHILKTLNAGTMPPLNQQAMKVYDPMIGNIPFKAKAISKSG
jgi:hypothetical protein